MEEIKNLFVKHFGFLPDIISTTEHAYISPPSRILSSLAMLSGYQKKVLRLVITDKYVIHPENCISQICLPHILNKNLFNIRNCLSKTEMIQKFNNDIIQVEDILKNQTIFSKNELLNYIELMDIYKRVLNNIDENFDLVYLYSSIIKEYTKLFEINDLHDWLEKTSSFGIDSDAVRLFLKESFNFLQKKDPIGVGLFGEYLVKNKRLKCDYLDIRKTISWNEYLENLDNFLYKFSMPFEIVLYVYSYYGGSHFGNDYGMVEDINKLRNTNNPLQLTTHNQDFIFEVEIKDVQFQKISYSKEGWSLSHRLYKPAKTLSELYILLGKHNLQTKLSLSIL